MLLECQIQRELILVTSLYCGGVCKLLKIGWAKDVILFAQVAQ